MSNLASATEVGALLTTAQVARIVGKAPSTVNRWAESGRLHTAAKAPGIRGARLFHPEDVAKLQAELSAKASA